MSSLRRSIRTVLVWSLLVLAFLFIYSAQKGASRVPEAAFTRLMEDASKDAVSKIEVDRDELLVHLYGGNAYKVWGKIEGKLLDTLNENDVVMVPVKNSDFWPSIISSLLPIVVLVAVFIFFLRRMSGGGAQGWMSLRKTTAKLISEERKVKFSDVGGCAQAKELLGDLVDYLKNPTQWAKLKVRPPKGILLEGPPGCGKTMLARAVAGETNAKFFYLAGSEFVELFVGVGAARVRDTFEVASKQTPAVLFIDELDAVGRRRGSGMGTSHEEREQTLNQLLVCLDGVQSYSAIVVIAATNRADILDRALVRPGRFDRVVRVSVPTVEERLEILKLHMRDRPLADGVSLENIAAKCGPMSGAALEALANEASIQAMRRRDSGTDAKKITDADFMAAINTTAGVNRGYTQADALLIESGTQLAEPKGKVILSITLDEGEVIEGEVVWADSQGIKVRRSNGSSTIVSKKSIKKIDVIEGGESLPGGSLEVDPWAKRVTDVA